MANYTTLHSSNLPALWISGQATAAGQFNTVRRSRMLSRWSYIDEIVIAERNPNTEVIGVDLNWLSPTRVVPENCSFDIANAEEPWEFLDGEKVDFAFLRFLGWFTDWRKIFSLMYENLVPGGWIEIHEWIIDFQSSNGSLEGTALRHWNSLVEDGESAQLTGSY